MSVRAYRIIKVEGAGESFNLWHAEKLVDYLNGHTIGRGIYDSLNCDGCGQFDVEIEVIQEAIDKAEELELDEFTVKALEADIEAAGNDEWVLYDCF